jgi:hypothetical protein
MNSTKLLIPVLIFFIIANPFMYKVTGKFPVLGPMIADPSGRPTQFGVAVHAVVYAVIAHLAWKILCRNK